MTFRRTLAASLAAVAVAAVAACASPPPPRADPRSDAPERVAGWAPPALRPADYADALRRWHAVADINAWIGANFEYDMARALQLSETQRERGSRLPILSPGTFYARPSGVCVDLARFGVETMRAVAPQLRPAYLMIEFDPVSVAGQTLRRHWLVSFERDGQRYFFADSKRPGHIAGPYASTQAFIDEYARYRGRRIVAFREAESYERRLRTLARRERAAGAP